MGKRRDCRQSRLRDANRRLFLMQRPPRMQAQRLTPFLRETNCREISRSHSRGDNFRPVSLQFITAPCWVLKNVNEQGGHLMHTRTVQPQFDISSDSTLIMTCRQVTTARSATAQARPQGTQIKIAARMRRRERIPLSMMQESDEAHYKERKEDRERIRARDVWSLA